jgi:DNA-binding transcriptional regulator YdaS (Cro superfamily)
MKQPSLAELATYDPRPLLDTVTECLNVKNDAALSRALAVAPPIISKVRTGKAVVSAALLIRIHEITNISIKELRALMGDFRPIFC